MKLGYYIVSHIIVSFGYENGGEGL